MSRFRRRRQIAVLSVLAMAWALLVPTLAVAEDEESGENDTTQDVAQEEESDPDSSTEESTSEESTSEDNAEDATSGDAAATTQSAAVQQDGFETQQAEQNDDDKVWVCKFVGPPGNERLKGGTNPIHVSVNSTDAQEAFSDSHPSFVTDEVEPGVFDPPCPPDDEVLPDEAALALVKTADPETATLGDEITYTFLVINVGEATISNLTLVDDHLGDLTDELATTTLATGESTTVEATYTVTQDDVDAGSIVNVAIVSGTDPEGAPVSAEDTATVQVVAVEVEDEDVVVDDDVVVVADVVVVRELPATGAEAETLLLLGLLLAALGATALLFSRREPTG